MTCNSKEVVVRVKVVGGTCSSMAGEGMVKDVEVTCSSMVVVEMEKMEEGTCNSKLVGVVIYSGKWVEVVVAAIYKHRLEGVEVVTCRHM